MLQKCVNCRASNNNLQPHCDTTNRTENNITFVIKTVRAKCALCHTIYGNTVEESTAKKLIAKILCLSSDTKCNTTLRFCLTQAGITQDNAEEILGTSLVTKIPLTKMLTANLKNQEIKELPTILWRKIAEKISKETAHITCNISKQKSA